ALHAAPAAMVPVAATAIGAPVIARSYKAHAIAVVIEVDAQRRRVMRPRADVPAIAPAVAGDIGRCAAAAQQDARDRQSGQSPGLEKAKHWILHPFRVVGY